ncbi:MAG: 4Fe-4S dicluster domain-containing protein [bacterium]
MKRIKIKKELCMSCLSCAIACMASHSEGGKNKPIYELNLSDSELECRNHITMDSHNHPTPIFCRHCEEPECVYTCMSGAMSKNPDTGYVEYDADKCASCYMCVMNCRYGVLKTDDRSKSKIMKCDMCKDSGIPSCVASCPTGALYMDEEE